MERNYSKVRKLVENLYANAVVLRQINPELAKETASHCLQLLSRLPDGDMEDIATSRIAIGGVLLPDFLTLEIVKQKFSDFGIKF